MCFSIQIPINSDLLYIYIIPYLWQTRLFLLILLLLTWQGYVVCPHRDHGEVLQSKRPIVLVRPLRLVRGKGVRS